MALSRSNFFVARAKESPAFLRIRTVGLLFAAFRPATLAALALVHTHGHTARRVHHFSGQNKLRTASAPALFRCLWTCKFIAAEIIHVKPPCQRWMTKYQTAHKFRQMSKFS